MSPADVGRLFPLLGAVLPPLLQQKIEAASGRPAQLAAVDQLWLELELQSSPTVPTWTAPQIAGQFAPPDEMIIQNLQPGGWLGTVLRSLLARHPSAPSLAQARRSPHGGLSHEANA